MSGITLVTGGDLGFGLIGLGGSAVIFHLARIYALHAVRKGYLTNDEARIGFQVHNILGNPGRKYEFPIGNAKVLEHQRFFLNSVIPVSVKGMGYNLLLDPDGIFHDKNKLISILKQSDASKQNMSTKKEDRINSIKNHFRNIKNKSKKI